MVCHQLVIIISDNSLIIKFFRYLSLYGWPGGFFMLDTRQRGICNLAYFGLVQKALGQLTPGLREAAVLRDLQGLEACGRKYDYRACRKSGHGLGKPKSMLY